MAGGENLSEKNRKLRTELIEKVKGLRGELKTLEDERRSLSNQFSETLENLKKKVRLNMKWVYITFLQFIFLNFIPF